MEEGEDGEEGEGGGEDEWMLPGGVDVFVHDAGDWFTGASAMMTVCRKDVQQYLGPIWYIPRGTTWDESDRAGS